METFFAELERVVKNLIRDYGSPKAACGHHTVGDHLSDLLPQVLQSFTVMVELHPEVENEVVKLNPVSVAAAMLEAARSDATYFSIALVNAVEIEISIR